MGAACTAEAKGEEVEDAERAERGVGDVDADAPPEQKHFWDGYAGVFGNFGRKQDGAPTEAAKGGKGVASQGSKTARVKLVTVTGAGLKDVNGEYKVMEERFLGAERFVKDSALGKIYIRRLAADDLDTWVITLSESDPDAEGNLYLREDVPEAWGTPPLFGWDPCERADRVPEHLLEKLGSAPEKLEYYYGQAVSSPRTGPQSPKAKTHSLVLVGMFGATGLPSPKEGEPSDGPYCVLEIPTKPESGIIKTLPVPESNAPEWKFTSGVEGFAEGDELSFSVYRGSDLLGQATLRKKDYHPSGFVGEVPLSPPSGTAGGAMLSLCVTLPNQETPGIRMKINKKAGQVGVSIAPEVHNDALSIRTIKEGGLVHQWNQKNPQHQVKVRDRVVEVNKHRGSCRDLLVELEASHGEVELLVRRKMSA